MANEKILAFRVSITGASQEAKGIAEIDKNLVKLNATRTRLLKKQKDGITLTGQETKKLAETTSKTKDLQAAKSNLNKVETQSARAFKATSGSMAELRARTSKLRAEMEQLNLKTEQGRQKQKQMATEVKNNTKTIRDYDRGLSGSKTLVGEYAKGITQAFKGIGAGILVGVVALKKFTQALVNATTEFAEFEKGQINVQTLLDDFDLTLESKSINLIKQYGLEISDMNKAMFDAVSAGVSAADSVEFMETATKLAIGGVSDLTTAVDGITSVINAYGLETKEADQVASAFFTAQKFGKTTVSQLAAEIGNTAPIAKQLGVSYQELLTTYAELTKQGIKTDKASTAIKATLTALQKPSESAKKKFDELGIATGAVAIKQNGLFQTLVKISEATENNADDLAVLIPNVRALTGVGALGTRQLEEYHKILETVNRDYGEGSSLARAFAMQQETVAQSLNRIRSFFDTTKIKIGEFFAPLIKGFADAVNPTETLTMKLRKQKAELNNMIRSITAATTSEASRARQIEKLNIAYPKFLGNLNAETVTNEELAEKLVLVNDEYEKRIKLAISEEIYARQSSKIAELIEQEDLLSEILAYNQGIVDGTVVPEIGPAATAIMNAAPGNVRRYTNELEENRETQDEINASLQRQLEILDKLKVATGGGNTPDGSKSTYVPPIAVVAEITLPTEEELDKELEGVLASFTAFAEEEMKIDENANKLMIKRLRQRIKREDELVAAGEKEKFNSRATYLQYASQAMNEFASIFSANLDREIEMAGDNEKKQEEIKLKYYRREQAFAVLNSVINTFLAVTKAQAQTGVLSPFVIPAIIATGALSVAGILAQKFAEGGLVQSGSEIPGAPKNGDNTLAIVQPGEVVLNKSQQFAAGGSDFFKSIGVPGFATGGIMPGGSPMQSAGSLDGQFAAMAREIINGINNKQVVLNINELHDSEKELEIISKSSVL